MGTRAAGAEASLLQVNHKKNVNGGRVGTQASGAEASFQAEGTVSVKVLSPVGSLAPTYSPGGWGLCEVTGMGHKSPWGWGPGVFDCWPVWQGPSQS